jgi:phosphatidylglycerol lysyltransferase
LGPHVETGKDGVQDRGKQLSSADQNAAIARARELVLAHGWNSTSFQIINPGIKRWFAPKDRGVVGYMSASGVRVVAGAPVCAKEDLAQVTSEFETDAARSRERVCYFGAEARLESTLSGSGDHSMFLLGAQPTWQPSDWAAIVAGHRSFRAQINRARNKGVQVSEWPIEKAREHPLLQQCLNKWLDSKGLPPLHFMVEPDTLSRLENRRVFVAEAGGNVVGFVLLSPVATRNGWLFEQFPHVPGAPNGTVDLMVHKAMSQLAAEGYDYATLGLSPLSHRAAVAKFENPLWLRILLAWLRKHGQRFYNFDGLDAFKAKLRPDKWEPVFAVYNQPEVSFRAIYAIASVFSGNAPGKLLLGGVAKAAATELRWLKMGR